LTCPTLHVIVTLSAVLVGAMDEQELQALKGQVSQLYERNMVIADGRRYHAPSLGPWAERRRRGGLQGWAWGLAWGLAAPFTVRYPHQWFWDSCAHAIALSHLDADLAWAEIGSLLALQREDGFIPHMAWNPAWKLWRDAAISLLYANPMGSPYVQPPNLARAVELVYERADGGDELRRSLPGVAEYYDYLDATRNIDGDGLLVIVHPYESGRDRAPEFDEVLRASTARTAWPLFRLLIHHRMARWRWDAILARSRFLVKETLFNCVYAQNLASLARLLAMAGQPQESERFHRRALQTETAISGKMFDGSAGLAWSLDRGRGDRPLRARTLACLMPLLLETIEEAAVERLLGHLCDPREFWLPYPAPAALQGPGLASAHAIWRGPQTWLYTNWFLMDGLHRQARRFPNMKDRLMNTAGEIAERSHALVRQEGFREYYDSYDGRGGGARDMGWSALVLDMMVRTAGGA